MGDNTLGALAPTYKDVREKKRQAFLAAAWAERTGTDADRQKAEAAQIRYDVISNLYEQNGRPSHNFYKNRDSISIHATSGQEQQNLSSGGHGRVTKVVNGVVVYEAWYRHGKLHGEHGAALIRRDPATGAVIEECWMKAGKLQRATAPAWIQHDAKTGVATAESWWSEGQRHRIDAPAQITRDGKTGKVIDEAWFEGGAKLNAPVLAATMIRDMLKNFARHLTLS